MNKVIFLILFILITSNVWAAGKKTHNFTTLETSFRYSYLSPNGWGDSTKDTFMEVLGVHRYGPLDLYWYIDYSNIFKTPKLSDKFYSAPNYIFGEINPRLSIDWITGADLSFLFFKEWFLAYDFEFDSTSGIKWGREQGLLRHYLGIGTDLNIPLFDYVKVNIYGRYIQENYGRSENSWDGYMLNIAYALTIHKFKWGLRLGYSSWMKWVFSARTDSSSFDEQTSDSIQWNNSFDITYAGFGIVYTYKVNYHYSEVDQFSSNNHNQSIGIKYSITF